MSKLLLLDDEPATLEWMTAALTGFGYEVRAYQSGRDALRDMHGWRPDLVIADILMPEMDGFAFARAARSQAGPPVLFISIAMKQAEAILAGAVGYVQKPATAPEIRAAVADVLGHAPRRATILVADDDIDTRDLYVKFLASFDVLEADDGAQALALIRRRPVDLVITDFHMPNMNGLELIRELRADPKLERVPVIVQSSDPVALTSPAWAELNVAYKLDKLEFLRWLRQTIDATLGAMPPAPPGKLRTAEAP
jgi:CheY-like chemotaxis protein